MTRGHEGVRGMNEEKETAPGGEGRERECLISRFGNTEIIQTKDSIRIQERCKCRQGSEPMEHYPDLFLTVLQLAADAVGKSWEPERHTEAEIQQLYELWMEDGIPIKEFAKRHL